MLHASVRLTASTVTLPSAVCISGIASGLLSSSQSRCTWRLTSGMPMKPAIRQPPVAAGNEQRSKGYRADSEPARLIHTRRQGSKASSAALKPQQQGLMLLHNHSCLGKHVFKLQLMRRSFQAW